MILKSIDRNTSEGKAVIYIDNLNSSVDPNLKPGDILNINTTLFEVTAVCKICYKIWTNIKSISNGKLYLDIDKGMSIFVEREEPTETLADSFPRKCNWNKMTEAEKAIFNAIQEVERAGVDTKLTDVVVALGKAKDNLSDFIDNVPPKVTSLHALPASGSGNVNFVHVAGATILEGTVSTSTNDWDINSRITDFEHPQEGVKESAGKLEYELDWYFIEAMAERMQINKEKYGKDNWKAPMDIESLKQSLFRHVMEVMKGDYDDADDNLGHLKAIALNAQFIHYQLERYSPYSSDEELKELFDRLDGIEEGKELLYHFPNTSTSTSTSTTSTTSEYPISTAYNTLSTQ